MHGQNIHDDNSWFFIELSGIDSLTRIIRDSYLKVDLSERPRIFGMTASPIDGKANIIEAAR